MLNRLTVSERLARVQAPVIPIVGELIRQVPGTISLGQGAVSFGPPPEAIARLERALADPDSYRYGDAAGLPELIERLSDKLARENGITTCSPAAGDASAGSAPRIMVTAGSNMAFLYAVLAIAEPDDEIVLLTPYYFNHEMAIAIAGCRAQLVPTDDRYQPRLEAIRHALTPRTRAVVTVSPNNPTGAVYPAATLHAINDLCRAHGIYHICDEVYEYFTFDRAPHYSPGSADGAADHTISMFSFSKAYGLAGLRVGYFVYPAHLEDAMIKTQDTVLVNTPAPAQAAACGALDAGRAFTDRHLADIAAARAVVLDRLRGLDVVAAAPVLDGAFYCLLHVDTHLRAMAVCERLIREHRVAVLPGDAFGMTDGCYLRVAYGALGPHEVEQGIARLTAGLRAIVRG